MILDTILARLAPHECLGCSTEGTLLCLACEAGLIRWPERCYRCKKLSVGWRTCPTCRQHSPLFLVTPGCVYERLGQDLVWKLKFGSGKAAVQEMARLMRQNIPDDRELVFVAVPTATGRARQRGYDQSVELARELARITGLPYVPALRRLGQAHQVGASRKQRVTQLQEAYRVARPELLAGMHVVLVDDVLTTGATLEAAARIIKAAGAKHVSGVVFAQA